MRIGAILVGLFLIMVCQAQPAGPGSDLLRALETAQSSAKVGPLLQRLARALEEGYFFGQEVQIARLTLRFWQDPSTPTGVLRTLRTVYVRIAGTLAVMDPALSETVLVKVPGSWLAQGVPERQDLALDMLGLAAEEPLLRKALDRGLSEVIAKIFERGATDAEKVHLFKLLLSAIHTSVQVTLPPAFVAWLRTYQGPDAWKIPDLLSKDTSEAGTEALLAFALDPPSPPPLTEPWKWTRRDFRQVFLLRLKKRRLNSEQKRRLFVAAAEDSTFLEDIAELIQSWIRAGETLPPPPASLLPTLKAWMVQKHEVWDVQNARCEVAAHLLALSREGLEYLFRLEQSYIKDERSLPCDWDRWSALWAHAQDLVSLLEEAYRAEPAPWLLRLLAAAGQWDRVLEALEAPDPSLRREAAFLLRFGWVSPDDIDRLAALGSADAGEQLRKALKARPEVLSRALPPLRSLLQDPDEGVRGQALETLLLSQDREAAHEIAQMLLQGGEASKPILRALSLTMNLPLPAQVSLALVQVARQGADALARVLAITALRLGQPEDRGRLEPKVRALLGDADAGVRRAAAEYFTRVPASETVTVARLLEASRDPDAYVRHAAAQALGLARAFSPELVDALAKRLQEGDRDEDVRAALEGAYLHALRHEPGSVDQLLAVLLRREGSARWRRALAKGPPVSSEVAQALLERLSMLPLKEWAPFPKRYGPLGIVRMLQDMLAAEEDPPAFYLVKHLVPTDQFNPWLVERVLNEKEASLEHRLWLLQEVVQIPEAYHDAVQRLVLQAIREEVGGEMTLGLLARFGFAGTRRLVEALWDDPPALQRAARYLLKQENLVKRRGLTGSPGGPGLPLPAPKDLPWVETMLARVQAGARDPRLGSLVELSKLYELGNDPLLRKAVFQTRIPQLLYRHLADPVECQTVAPALGSLHHRGVWPKCP